MKNILSNRQFSLIQTILYHISVLQFLLYQFRHQSFLLLLGEFQASRECHKNHLVLMFRQSHKNLELFCNNSMLLSLTQILFHLFRFFFSMFVSSLKMPYNAHVYEPLRGQSASWSIYHKATKSDYANPWPAMAYTRCYAQVNYTYFGIEHLPKSIVKGN